MTCCLWHPNLWPNAPISRHNRGIESGMNMETRRSVQQSKKGGHRRSTVQLRIFVYSVKLTVHSLHTRAHVHLLLASVLASRRFPGACRCDGLSGASHLMHGPFALPFFSRSGIDPMLDPMKCPQPPRKPSQPLWAVPASHQWHHISLHFTPVVQKDTGTKGSLALTPPHCSTQVRLHFLKHCCEHLEAQLSAMWMCPKISLKNSHCHYSNQ